MSEVASELAKDHPAGVAFSVMKDGRIRCSIRSREDNPDALDVEELAAVFSGGGHKHSAGFTLFRLPEPVGGDI